MKFQAVLFDLDNTLTHREQSINVFSQHLFEVYQADLTITDQAKITEIIHYIDHGGYPILERLTHKSIAASVAQALIEQLEWSTKPSLETLTQFWFEQFAQSAVAMQGALPLLEHLKAENYKLAVVSNGQHASRLNILKKLGFADYFDEIISSEKIGVAKPKAEIFSQSCSLLGVKPSQSLFVGDHPINDFQGAKAAGLQALLLDGFHDNTVENEHKISTLSGILKHLD